MEGVYQHNQVQCLELQTDYYKKVMFANEEEGKLFRVECFLDNGERKVRVQRVGLIHKDYLEKVAKALDYKPLPYINIGDNRAVIPLEVKGELLRTTTLNLYMTDSRLTEIREYHTMLTDYLLEIQNSNITVSNRKSVAQKLRETASHAFDSLSIFSAEDKAINSVVVDHSANKIASVFIDSLRERQAPIWISLSGITDLLEGSIHECVEEEQSIKMPIYHNTYWSPLVLEVDSLASLKLRKGFSIISSKGTEDRPIDKIGANRVLFYPTGNVTPDEIVAFVRHLHYELRTQSTVLLPVTLGDSLLEEIAKAMKYYELPWFLYIEDDENCCYRVIDSDTMAHKLIQLFGLEALHKGIQSDLGKVSSQIYSIPMESDYLFNKLGD